MSEKVASEIVGQEEDVDVIAAREAAEDRRTKTEQNHLGGALDVGRPPRPLICTDPSAEIYQRAISN
jgi:hypothetical protein